MAPRPVRSTAPRRHGQRISSQDSLTDIPHTTIPLRRGARNVRANSPSEQPLPSIEIRQPTPEPSPEPSQIPAHYFLSPTIPNPFPGTLEASLDAILSWNQRSAPPSSIVTPLLEPPDSTTDWPALLGALWADPSRPPAHARRLTEDLLFLLTRTLLPNQIVENRRALTRVYDFKKQLSSRLLLRYDMLRSWKQDMTSSRESAIAVPSVVPARQPDPPAAVASRWPGRRAWMPNVLATLIAAPEGGYAAHSVRERMRHHVTDLDGYLLLEDGKVEGWSGAVLIGVTGQVVLQWQWLRRNNEVLEELEAEGWEELESKAEDCEWIADDANKGRWRRRLDM